MPGLPPVLRPLGLDRAHSALFLDYDGTLAPIVVDPEAARPLPAAPELLARLAAAFSLVAVVSGRPASFLARVLGTPPGLRLVGLYGMETAGPTGVVPSPEAERWRPAVARVAAQARALAPDGLGVEDKGLSVTLHWRAHPATESWARDFAGEAAAGAGLVLQAGRMALELRPPVASDKGTVVEAMAAGHVAVACFGDDLGDLPAFAALDRLAGRGTRVARVAVADPESAPEVLAAADVVVEGPEGALELLAALLDG